MKGKLLLAAGLAATAFVLALPAAPASAGRLVATGHDVDDHCDPSDEQDAEDLFEDLFIFGQCGFMQVATNYVRGGAPDPSKPVLLLQCTNESAEDELLDAFETSFPGAAGTAVCPSDPADGWASLPLTTDSFSALVTGTSCEADDDSLNLTDECEQEGADPAVATPDSVAINARKADIEAFFNQGGGIFAMSGSHNGDGDPSTGPDVYYDFLPLTADGLEVEPPFCLTDHGIALGFHDLAAGPKDDEGACEDPSKQTGDRNDINCCETHNSFAEPPPGSLLQVTERQVDGFPETLTAEGFIVGGQLVSELPAPQPAAAPTPAPAPAAAPRPGRPRLQVAGVRSRCRNAGTVRVPVRARAASGARITRITATLDGRRIASTRRSRLTVRVGIRRLRPGRHRLRIVATDSAGNRTTIRRTIARCAQRPRRVAPRFTG